LSHLLESLCALFDEELERQETLLALTKAQGEAAIARDTAVLEARTTAIRNLVAEALRAEPVRLELVGAIVEAYALPEQQQTLSGLIAAAEDPWKSRLRWHQERLQSVLAETQATVRSNHRVISRLSRGAATLLRLFTGDAESQVYGARGSVCAELHAAPRLVNQAG